MHMANNVKNAKVTHGKRTFNEISVMFQNQLDFPIAQSTHLIRKKSTSTKWPHRRAYNVVDLKVPTILL